MFCSWVLIGFWVHRYLAGGYLFEFGSKDRSGLLFIYHHHILWAMLIVSLEGWHWLLDVMKESDPKHLAGSRYIITKGPETSTKCYHHWSCPFILAVTRQQWLSLLRITLMAFEGIFWPVLMATREQMLEQFIEYLLLLSVVSKVQLSLDNSIMTIHGCKVSKYAL